jgi:beta-glucanase (GH16 family)
MTTPFGLTKARGTLLAGCAILTFLAGSQAGGLVAAAGAMKPPFAGYRLAFDEEFDHFDLSPNGAGQHVWYEGVWFHPNHVPLANIASSTSEVSLTWKRGQPSFDTSMTTLSGDKQHYSAWRYGYFETRMKWEVAPGAWPALWLLPVQDALGQAVNSKGVAESGEVDMFEGQGDHPHAFYGTVHDWVDRHDVASKDNQFTLPTTVDFSQYHTYGTLWVPGKFTWYLDGQPLHSEPAPAVFDRQDYFMVVSMAEGAHWKPNNLEGVSASSLRMTVGWIRVWKL